MSSSRKYNVKRHIQNVHNGNGRIVSFIDYEVGRRSGIYPPVLPPLYVKKSNVTAIPKIRLVDIFQNEFLKALAWKAVNISSFPKQEQQQLQPLPLQQLQQQNLLRPNYNSIQPQVSPSYHPPSYSSFVPKLEDIFGFEACVCDKCSAVKAIMICYGNENDECGQVRIGIPCCNSIELPNISKKANEVDKQILVKILKDVVDVWTKNDDNNKEILAVALKLSSDKITIVNHKIKVVKCETPNGSITLRCLEEKCIELTNPGDENYWAIRAIKNKQTTLDDEELVDFLQKVGDATFGFFKVNSELYLMAIAVMKMRIGHQISM
jgi:hypothetical protein